MENNSIFSFICFALVIFSFVNISSTSVNPDAEDGSETLQTFSASLELYSGLSSNEAPPITVACEDPNPLTQCAINPNGTIVWDVRQILYARHMMQNYALDSQEREITIDGCLKFYNETETSFLNCMKTVRENMIDYLKNDFEKLFRSLLEEDCSQIYENCVM